MQRIINGERSLASRKPESAEKAAQAAASNIKQSRDRSINYLRIV